MMLLVVTFGLTGVSDADYRDACEQEAPAFASVPGLVSKAWVASEATNTYGGVYTFVDRASLDAYIGSDLFRSIGDDASVENLTTQTFDVLEGASRVTHFAPQRVASRGG